MRIFLFPIVFSMLSFTIPMGSIYDEFNVSIAAFKNATTSQVAFTSFEGTSKGYWTYSGATSGSAVDKGRTGNKYYALSGGQLQRTGLPAGRYSLSYWARTGTPTVSGTNYTLISSTNRIVNGWTLYTLVINLSAASSSLTISGSAQIDEVRLLPFDAEMTTLTYDQLVGITSETNENNLSLFYEYDEFGRLKITRDQYGNIIQTIDYQAKTI